MSNSVTMATPAEIIAARVNGTYVENFSESGSAGSSPSPESVSTNGTSRSIADASAFPVLGGVAKSPTGSATPWGPNASGNPAPAAPVAAPKLSEPSTKFKSSTVQEAFSLDAEDQLNVARPEFIKILTSIKTDTRANIECTTSQHTKKRTFLITGKPDQVKSAKRLVIKKLTKPVLVTFTIPAKVRSRVIGAQGRNLKPIILQNEVKVDIGNLDEESEEAVDDDDVYAKTVKVTIDGDADGCKNAKAQILAIVKEETKNLSIKIAVDDFLKPFVANAVEAIVSKYPQLDFSIPPYYSSSKNVIVLGDREAALEARDEIKEALAVLEAKIVVESVPIPQIKHQFLPIESTLEEHSVLIKLPDAGETEVKFIGEKKNIATAQEKARKTTSQYKVEVLDMSRAHKGNLAHVRAIACLLNKNGAFKNVSDEHGVAINPPTDEFLQDESNSTIPIEIVVKNDDLEGTKNARKAIVSMVNKISPDQTKVVTDIDAFFIAKAPAFLEKTDAEFAVLGDRIILFDISAETDDFDFEESSSDVLEVANRALDELRELQASLLTSVLTVPAGEQSAISGPKGTTLRSILAAAEPESVIVKLHSNGTKTSNDEVYIHGLKTEVAKVEKDIVSVLADAKEFKETGGYKTSIEVPTFILSRIIGKGGANLNALRDEFGVRVDIADEGRDSDSVTDKSRKSELSIAGIRRNAEEAKNSISKLAKKFADDTLVRMRIEGQYHRRMIGPNFIYINRLQDKYSVKIRFPSENASSFADAPKSKDEVTIRGPSKGVAKAEEELKELYQFEKENGFKATLQVPTKAVARIIGKNGESINDIADGTGVDYRFRNRDDEEKLGYAEVELTGSRSALKDATQKIQDIIDEVENHVTVTINVPPKYHRDLVGPSGSVMREILSQAGGDHLSRPKYARLLSIPNEGSGSDEVVSQGDKQIVDKIIEQIKLIVAEKEAAVTEQYDLSKEKHKLIVGPGGSIRHALQHEFGVQINIPRPNESSTTIKLSGLPAKIELLRAKLDEMTKDNWNESIDIPYAYHSLVSDRGAVFKTLRTDYNVEVAHGNLTRKASTLSNASVPAAPASATPEEGSTKFTVEVLPDVEASDAVIPWRLIGDAQATAKAASYIQARLERAKSSTNAAWFYSANPANHFPRIVGPQGSKINEIRKATGAFITVPRPSDKNGKFIYLVGTEESLQKAQEALVKLAK